MSPYYWSLRIQIIYNLTVGTLLIIATNPFLTFLGFSPTTESWVSLLGLLAIALTFYYVQMIRHGNKEVILGTVYGRLFFTLSAIALSLFGFFPLALISVMTFEAILALWTYKEVRH